MSNYYDSNDQTFKPIPKAPYYVVSTDKFMSGWGGAKGKTNRCIVPCESWDQAEKVSAYVESRNDQNYINISVNKPRTKSHILYSLMTGWIKNI